MKKTQKQFNVLFRPEKEGGFTAIVPSLPGCITYGKTLTEAKKMSAEAIDAYLESLEKHRETVFSDEESFVGQVSIS